MDKGPNDASGVVWALIVSFFLFIFVFFLLINVLLYLYRFSSTKYATGREEESGDDDG